MNYRAPSVACALAVALLGRLRETAAPEPEGRTLFTTTGWDAGRFPEQRAPTRDELDAVTRRHPVVVYASRGRVHLNSAALGARGITRGTTALERVTAGTDGAGEPDGVLTGSPAAVLNLMRRVVPPPELAEAKAIIRNVQARQHAELRIKNSELRILSSGFLVLNS